MVIYDDEVLPKCLYWPNHFLVRSSVRRFNHSFVDSYLYITWQYALLCITEQGLLSFMISFMALYMCQVLHIVHFLRYPRMETEPTSIEVLLRPTQSQSDKPSDLRGSLSPTSVYQVQHLAVPGGHPSNYEPGATLLNFSDRAETDERTPYSVYSSFIHLFIHLFIHSFIHRAETDERTPYSVYSSFIHSFIHLFIHSFIHSFIYSFIHSFAHSFWHSIMHSIIR